MKLAVVLLLSLAAVLAWATLLEASRGREYAAWYVYSNLWFVAILALLGLNVLSAALIRFPWKNHQLGFVITHGGLLVLLAGAVQTFLFGIEGEVTLKEGTQADTLLVPSRSVIRVVQPREGSRMSTEFTFAPGPADWREGKSLDFRQAGGLGLKVLRFYRHARAEVEWVPDEAEFTGAALKLRLNGPSGNAVTEDWLTGNAFGGEAVIGPTGYQLWPLPVDTMIEDFLNPPGDLGHSGVLSVHYEGRRFLVSVDDFLNERFAVGESGVEVEIVAAHPDAKPSPKGGFFSRSDQPNNPLLELMVHWPDQPEPTKQIALAKRPLLTLDGVYGTACPVRFWYHRAGVPPTPGADFVQTPDGRLYCRAAVNGAYVRPVEVAERDSVALGGQFSVTILRHLARAREQVRFQAIQPAFGTADPPEAAALVEVTVDGVRRQVWLQRQDPRWGLQPILTERGPMMLEFDHEKLPLGYSLQLDDVLRDFHPGRSGDTVIASRVRLIDPRHGIDQQHEISMNAPLTHGRFTLYQSGFQDARHGVEISVLTAAYDPGRALKYVGCLMVCVGVFAMFYVRSFVVQRVPSRIRPRVQADSISASGSSEHTFESEGSGPLTLPRRRSPADSTVPCKRGDA